jgi:predicted ATP-dependent serine protease
MPVPTGSEVLDDMLDGGLPERRTVMITGGPGTGKTTFGISFYGLDSTAMTMPFLSVPSRRSKNSAIHSSRLYLR